MSRRHTVLFGFIVLFLASLACNAFAPSGGEPGAALPPPSIADLTMTPETEVIDGLAPTATLPNQEIATVDPNGQATVRVLVDLNIRKGPGVQYDRVGFLLSNETAPILGRDPISGWWKVICPPRVNEVTECWISGGAQYSASTNADNVPIAAVPPTPTPEPTVTATPESDDTSTTASNLPSGNSPFMIYTASDGLYISSLVDALNAPLAEGTQLVADPLIQAATISPNGQLIAYVTNIGNDQELRLYQLNTQSIATLVTLNDFDTETEDTFEVSIDAFEWVNNSNGIVFNTIEFNVAGPGIFESGDLFLVDLNGNLTELKSEGEFGGTFALNGSQIIGGAAESVLLTSTNGDTAVTLYEFPQVNTASEYIFYPQAQWIDSNTAYLAVPNAEPFTNGTFDIVQVSTSGTASTPVTLTGLSLFDSVRWSPNGSNIAYIDQVSETNISILNFGNGDGSNISEYDRGRSFDLASWSPNSNSFLYATQDYYAVGSRSASPTQFLLPDSEAALDMAWVNDNIFIASVGSRGQWQLVANDTAGNSNPLAIANVDLVTFDVWNP